MAIFELTPEQREDLQRQQAANPADRRVSLDLTDEQEAAVRKAREEEIALKPERIAWLHECRQAEQEPGFYGDLRRAINASPKRLPELLRETRIDPPELSDFRAGRADLSPESLDRLISALRLRLVSEIPGVSDE